MDPSVPQYGIASPHFIIDPVFGLLNSSWLLVVVERWVSMDLHCPPLFHFMAVTARASTSRATQVMRSRTTTTRETTDGRRELLEGL